MLLRNLLFIITVFAVSTNIFPAVATENIQETPHQSLKQLLVNKDRTKTGIRRLRQILDLNPEQEQQISEIYSTYRENISPIRSELRTEEKRLQELMVGTSSEDQLREQHKTIVNLREELADLYFEGILEIREVLTPEQRYRFREMIQQYRQNLGRRFSR